MSTFLFRFWIVAAACWYGFLYLMGGDEMFTSPIFAKVSIPPLVVFAVGAGIVWAGKGFR